MLRRYFNIIDINKSDKENFINFIVNRADKRYLLTKDIEVTEPQEIYNSYIEDTYFNKETITEEDIKEANDIISGRKTINVDYYNTKVIISSKNFEPKEVFYYRRDLASIYRIANEYSKKIVVYNHHNQEEYIARTLNIPKDSFTIEQTKDFIRDGSTPNREVVGNRTIYIKAKPKSLLFRGTAEIVVDIPLRRESVYRGDPLVNPRSVPGAKFAGREYRSINQFNLTVYDNGKQLLDNTKYGWNANPTNTKIVNNLNFSTSVNKTKYNFLDKYFPRGITHYTQYLTFPIDKDLSMLPEGFLATGCFDEYIQAFNRHHGGIYTNNQVRNLNANELRNAYLYLGNVIAFPPTMQYVSDKVLTACNPKVLIVPPSVSFFEGATTFFLTNRVKTIYYDDTSRPFILYLQFGNSPDFTWRPNQQDAKATEWFASKGVALKRLKMTKVS